MTKGRRRQRGTWQRIPGIGRTGAGGEPFPVTATRQTPGGGSPRLEISLFSTGPVTVHAYLSPATTRRRP